MEKEFDEAELESALRRAFVDKGFETILYDGHVACRQPFLRAGIELGVDRGWLEVKSRIEESEYTADNYGLTEKGREYFGLG